MTKFYQTLNQAPRSMKHGKHRRAGAPAYGSPAQRTDHGTGRADAVYTVWPTFTEYKPQPPTVPYAGIRTGEIIGHRLWWAVPAYGEQHLCSLAHRRLWLPGETVSGDINEAVEVDPFQTIWGGTYAFRSADLCAREVATVLFHQSGSWARPSSFVVGTVKMWGEVVEHEHGYRAEFAKLNSIEALYGPGDIDALCAKYGVTPPAFKTANQHE